MDTVTSLEKSTTGQDWRQRVIEIILAAPDPPAKRKITYEEFLAWADEDTLAEWVDGEVIMTSPASFSHQGVVGFLAATLRLYVEQSELGIVLEAPFQMRLPHSGREPDLIFLTAQHTDRLRHTYLDGPGDLVVEVVSRESISRDRGEKFYEYSEGGVPEYWLLDPEAQWAEFYHLEGQRYRLALEGAEGKYQSQVVPGFWLRVEWLWQRPRILDVLRELQIIN
jgi:Uma2 family endonuclease